MFRLMNYAYIVSTEQIAKSRKGPSQHKIITTNTQLKHLVSQYYKDMIKTMHVTAVKYYRHYITVSHSSKIYI